MDVLSKYGSHEKHDILSIDFKYALAIYTKSRSIITVNLHNSFIPLTTEKEREDGRRAKKNDA